MQEFKTARLSVSKVTPKEWDFIVDHLIEGYEDEARPAAALNDTKDDTLPTTTVDTPTINAATAGDEVVPTSDTIAPSVQVNGGTSRASFRKPSSRPTSRAPSKAPSRATSQGPSRQASLPPPRAQSRGRSRTPASRAGSVKPLTDVAEEMETVSE